MSKDNIYSFIKTLRPLYVSIEKKVEQVCAEHNITVAERAIVEQLYLENTLTVPKIANNLFLKRQSVQEVVNSLEHKKILNKKDNLNHKKSKLFFLTPMGKNLFKKIHSQEKKFLRKASPTLTRQEIESAIKVSTQLTAIFQEDF